MIGFSWNYHGLGNPRAILVLKDLLVSRKPTIIFLIETLVNANKIEEIKRKLGFVGSFCVDRIGRSSGLALLWHDSINVNIRSFSKSYIDAEVVSDCSNSW